MIIGSKIYRKKNCKSSFEWAKSCIDSASDGSLFICDSIENAKGRHGRRWQCYSGQLLLTFLLKPDVSKISSSFLQDKLNELMMIFSVGIAKSLNKYDVTLKWPNDFVSKGKKVGGMLGEIVWKGKNPEAIIVGVGLNVNNLFSSSDELSNIATSLKEISGSDLNLDFLLRNILKECNGLYTEWLNSRRNIFEEWKELQIYLGRNTVIHREDGSKISGLVQDFHPNGDMLLVDEKVEEHRLGFYQVLDVVVK